MSFSDIRNMLTKMQPQARYLGVRLCELAYSMVERAEAIGSGEGLFDRSDGLSQTRRNHLLEINAVASYLRKQPQDQLMTALEWQNVQKSVFTAMADYNGAAEGRAYDTSAFYEVLPDIGKNITDLPGDVADVAKDAVASVGWGLSSVLIVGAVAVAGYFILMKGK